MTNWEKFELEERKRERYNDFCSSHECSECPINALFNHNLECANKLDEINEWFDSEVEE